MTEYPRVPLSVLAAVPLRLAHCSAPCQMTAPGCAEILETFALAMFIDMQADGCWRKGGWGGGGGGGRGVGGPVK